MILTIAILFTCTMLGGLATNLLGYNKNSINLPLVFAGSYLFSITIIHILPELFSNSSNPLNIGLFILVGFFFQQLLERFTSGIEHGHFHRNHDAKVSHVGLLVALMIHSLMEGALLTHDSPFHEKYESYTLLIGIILHKAPAAFALMAVYQESTKFTTRQLLILILFSLASPVGFFISNSIALSSELLIILIALVSGVFLHISTTIFVESSPEHKFGFSKILISILGAAIAILSEYFI